MKRRLATRNGIDFVAALIQLKPHRDFGGNELLYLIHELDNIDKHKLLIPTADYRTVTSTILRQQVPDFPAGLEMTITNSYRDATWVNQQVPLDQLGQVRVPTLFEFERELDIPVEIVLKVEPGHQPRPLIPTLLAMTDFTRDAIGILIRATSK